MCIMTAAPSLCTPYYEVQSRYTTDIQTAIVMSVRLCILNLVKEDEEESCTLSWHPQGVVANLGLISITRII